MDYAIRCLVYLAKEKGGGWASTSVLGRRLQVPKIFLAKIFQKLAKAKIVETQRGKSGGVRLINKQITLAEVITILEPQTHLNKCLGKKFNCSQQTGCLVHPVLRKMEEELFAKLRQVTLSKLAQKGGNKW